VQKAIWLHFEGNCAANHHACEHRHSTQNSKRGVVVKAIMHASIGIREIQHAGKVTLAREWMHDTAYTRGRATLAREAMRDTASPRLRRVHPNRDQRGLNTCFTLMHHKTGCQKKGVQDQAICANIAAAAIEPTTCRIALLVKLAPPALGPSPPKSFSVTPQVSSVDAQSSVSCAA